MNTLQPLKTYLNPESTQFVSDMQAIDLEAFHHKGRFYWEGPAVWVADNEGLKKALDASRNPAQWDRYKEGYLIFPAKADEGT